MSTRCWSDRATAFFILVAIASTLSITGAFERLDNLIFDTAQRHYPRAMPADVVLVNIDEASLSRLGRWPWSRHLHAQLIRRLHADGAKAIGLDILFIEPQANDPQADALLASAIAEAGNVVLPIIFEKTRANGQLMETMPLQALADKAAGIGRVHAELDADSLARSITMWEGLGSSAWPHFAQSVLVIAGQFPKQLDSTTHTPIMHQQDVLVRKDKRYINFVSGHVQPPSISYVQVLRGEFPTGMFQGKVVLVGASASGMADSLPTPVSGFQQPMSGVEFLANTLISMRDQTLISRSPPWPALLLCCFLGVLPMLWMPLVSAQTGLIANTAYFLSVMALTMALPLVVHVWIPMSAALIAILSAYPVWTWRKLESASKFLDAELLRLQSELEKNGSVIPTQEATKQRNHDPFETRINQVQIATTHLKNVELEQRETLAFVSHDIRVPLASAVVQVESALGQQHPAYRQLSRALAWTEEFLQTSHAQMIDCQSFEEIELLSLLHQVVDEVYPLINSRGLQLPRQLPDGTVWVRGQFDLLMRAVSNILVNAIHFSPPGGTIELRVHVKVDSVDITISDQGQGIAPEQMDKLFQRFSRINPKPAAHPSGAGLGLYFVQTVITKHGGDVHVKSQAGQTEFGFCLPTIR